MVRLYANTFGVFQKQPEQKGIELRETFQLSAFESMQPTQEVII